MYLAEVRIQNFRNFRDITVELSAGLNVILGENNIGKTNFLDAIRIALGPVPLAGQTPRLSEEDLHISSTGEKFEQPIRVDLLFKDLSTSEQAEFLDCLNYNPHLPASSTASIHYEWSWSEKRRRWHHRRWGGQQSNSESAVSEDNLQALKVILLDALRDAVRELAPGRESRLGHLLSTVANDDDRSRIEEVFGKANRLLEEDDGLIKVIERRISAVLSGASRNLSQVPFLRASDAKFDRIVAGLRLLVHLTSGNGPSVYGELRSNGLGYNNLLFIGTVLAELESTNNVALPILLVEEPEAHLHPQLQTLLADFLGRGASAENTDAKNVQTIVTTHSPTIAAHVPPEVIRVLHRDREQSYHCTSLHNCGLAPSEMNRLRHMLDVTRATLLFSRGVLLVEGISEQILVPVLARRMGVDLAAHGISVVSMAGVSFRTIARLFGPDRIRMPVSIVTDADPEITYPDPKKRNWRNAYPRQDETGFVPGPRLMKLLVGFTDNDVVRVFSSSVTLEHDLAVAGEDNPTCIYEMWAGLYDRGPKSLTKVDLDKEPSVGLKALRLWRAICIRKPEHGKAELAQALAEELEARDTDGEYKRKNFEIPKYIRKAIEHVLQPSKDVEPHGGAS